jgi:hypothetical protein
MRASNVRTLPHIHTRLKQNHSHIDSNASTYLTITQIHIYDISYSRIAKTNNDWATGPKMITR